MSVVREMSLLRPPSQFQGVWTPDKKFLYISRLNVYSLDFAKAAGSRVKTYFLQTKQNNCIINLACDPYWTEEAQKCCLLLDTGSVMSYDFRLEHLIDLHHGHKIKEKQPLSKGFVHYTAQGMVISVVQNTIIRFCTISKQMDTFNQILPPKFSVTSLSVCPTDPNLMALGSFDGLIVLFSLNDMKSIHTFRGHDYQVTSFVWLPSLRCNRISAFDDDDCFDIYSEDHLQYEFGTESKRPAQKNSSIESPEPTYSDIAVHEQFNFAEACDSLREDILKARQNEEKKEVTSFSGVVPEYVDRAVSQELTDSDESLPSGLSARSNASSESSGEIEIMLEKIDLNDLIKIDMFLVSLDSYLNVWVWDIFANCARGNFKISEKFNKHSTKVHQTPMMYLLNDNQIVGNTNLGNIFHLNLHLNLKNIVEHEYRKVPNNYNVLGVMDNNKLIAYAHPDQLLVVKYNEIKNSTSEELKLTVNNGVGKTVAVSPINPMRIAIGGKELSIVDLPGVSDDFCPMKTFNKNIKNYIVSMAWHPEFEEILAFGTMEGRIGIYNSTKQTVDILKPFSGEEVYDLAFGKVIDEICLFATSNGICAYYSKKYTQLNFIFEDIRNVSAMFVDFKTGSLLIGTDQGLVYKSNVNNISRSHYLQNPSKVSTKYVRMFRLNCDGSSLAIATKEYTINIVDYKNFLADKPEIKKLKHQTDPITWIDFSMKDRNLLLSSSYDFSICLWNIASETVVSKFVFNRYVQYAIFSPLNEKCIIVGTISTPFYIFNTENKTEGFPPTMMRLEVKKEVVADNTGMAKIEQKEVVSQVRKTVVVKEESTIFYLAKKETTKKALACVESMLRDSGGGGDNTDHFLNPLIFSQDIEQIKGFLTDELKNYKASNIKSIGSSIINVMAGNLKDEIMNHLQNKTLTDEHVAVSPMVSFAFWQRCTEAYACQLVVGNQPLKAVLHLLTIHSVTKSIELLCEKHFYREAWVLAKLRKSEDDPIFKQISDAWIKEMGYCGDYEGAALVCVGTGDYKTAAEMLLKRREEQLTADHRTVINLLRERE